jgi:hypothetical protein
MRKYLLTSCVTLLCLGFCFAATKNVSYAVIDSLVGKAEIQRAGTQTWEKTLKTDKVYNNDFIRASAKAFVRLSWADGSTSFIHENSQIMLTFYESGESNIISRHITVFYGAVFFVLKEILPKTLTKSYDVKIFTPTAVVSLRGTSLSVEVDDKSGASAIRVLNGAVMVRNILKNASTFLSAGFKTTVEMKTDPIIPKPILDEDITALKTWVPVPVVDHEMTVQRTRAGRDHDLIVGDLKEKIIITPFINSSKYDGSWKIQTDIAQMLADQLSSAHCVIEIADSATQDPIILGEKAKARFVVIGEITDFDIVQHAEIAATADEYREYYLARVRIAIQMVSVGDRKVVFDNVFSGDMRGSNVKSNSWQKIGKMSFNIKDPQFSKSILGSALTQVLEQSSEKLVKQMSME